jgi:hypothetical protein
MYEGPGFAHGLGHQPDLLGFVHNRLPETTHNLYWWHQMSINKLIIREMNLAIPSKQIVMGNCCISLIIPSFAVYE